MKTKIISVLIILAIFIGSGALLVANTETKEDDYIQSCSKGSCWETTKFVGRTVWYALGNIGETYQLIYDCAVDSSSGKGFFNCLMKESEKVSDSSKDFSKDLQSKKSEIIECWKYIKESLNDLWNWLNE